MPKGQGYVAFIGAGQDDPVWPILRAGAERFIRDFGAIEVRYAAPGIDSPGQQIEVIRSLSRPLLRGLCIQVIEPEPLCPVFDELAKSGVRIVTVMRPVVHPAVDGHVGYDDAAIGRELGNLVVQHLPRPRPPAVPTIMILHEGRRSRAMRERYDACLDALSREPSIERRGSADCGGDPVRARAEIASAAVRFPQLSGWVALEPWPVRAWSPDGDRKSPLPEGCVLITCGAEPALWPYIESNVCPAVVGFDYGDAGFMAMQFCQGAIQSSEERGRLYPVPIRVVTAATLARYKQDWAAWSRAATTAP